MLTSLMRNNSWFPTVFDDFFNTDFMPMPMQQHLQSMSRRVRRLTQWSWPLLASRKNIAV